jgi:hypothetical protein
VIGTRASCPGTTRGLSPSERRFVAALQQLGFGHLESIKVRGGALILDPWPTMVQVLKFTAATTAASAHSSEFDLDVAINLPTPKVNVHAATSEEISRRNPGDLRVRLPAER